MEFAQSYFIDLVKGWFGIGMAVVGVVGFVEWIRGKPFGFFSRRRKVIVLVGCLLAAQFSVASALQDRLKQAEQQVEGLKEQQYQPGVDPVLDLAIGEPFGDHTLITVRNSGVVPIINFAANLRCFFLRERNDLSPVLFFEGFPSIGNKNSWWTVAILDSGTTHTKSAREALVRCLHNAEVESGARLTIVELLVSIDLVYERRADKSRYMLSGLARLTKDQDGGPFLWPLPMTDFHRRLLKTVTPPSYRTTSAESLPR